MKKKTGLLKSVLMGLGLVGAVAATQPASAGDYNGNFMVRVLGTSVVTQDSLKSLTANPAGTDLKAAGFDASVSNTVIPAATLTYFLNKNFSLELFCCFSKHNVDLSSPNAALNGNVAETWIFPPVVTLQYHFTGLGALKPYVGAGFQWIHYFNSKTGANPLGASGVDFSDSFGPTLQAGLDLELGGGWYLNADIKKSWLDTKVTWSNTANVGAGTSVVGKVDVDPMIISAGVGYRFNLEDLFGRRSAAYEPMK